MTKSTIHRIKEYIDFKGISVRLFEKSIGMSNGSFASQLKNDKTIGVDKVENILHIYSEINPDWLLTGTGSMLRDGSVIQVPVSVTHPPKDIPVVDSSSMGFILDRYEALAAENALLKQEIEQLKSSRGSLTDTDIYTPVKEKVGSYLAADPVKKHSK